MTSKERLTELIKKQIVIEEQVSKDIEKHLEMVNTAAAKLLLTEMKHDSRKHAAVLQDILEVIANSKLQLWDYKTSSYVDKLVVKKS